MRVDETPFRWAEVGESIIVVGFLLHQCPLRCASFAVFYYRNLERFPLVSPLVEGLELVAVVFVLDGEGLAVLDVLAQFISAEACDVRLENVSEFFVMLHETVGNLESRVDKLDAVL